jgi:hypothetical protein
MTFLRHPIRSTLIGVLFLVALLTLVTSPAHAAVVDSSSELVTVDNAPAVLSIAFAPTWVQLVTLIVTVVLPLLVGVVTTRETNSGRKAVYLAVLSAVAGFGSELLNALSTGQTYDAAAGLFVAVTSLIVAIALHFGVWKPTGLAAAAQKLGSGRHEATTPAQ